MVETPNVQVREAIRIAVPTAWLASYENRSADFSVVKLQTPFDGVQDALINIAATPPKGAEVLGIVGYPGDKLSRTGDGKPEAGGRIFEAWKEVNWDLAMAGHLIPHTIPTAAGMDPQQALLIVKVVLQLTLKRSIRVSRLPEMYEVNRSSHIRRRRRGKQFCLPHISRCSQSFCQRSWG
jgi:hypothetical protein